MDHAGPPVMTRPTTAPWPNMTRDETLTLALETSVLAPREARHAVATWMRARGLGDDLVNDVVLIVSELVTNAVMHAGSITSFSVRMTPAGRVRVEVGDDDDSPPEPNLRREVGGAGLHLIGRLSAGWDWAPRRGRGKVVWAEVAPDRAL